MYQKHKFRKLRWDHDTGFEFEPSVRQKNAEPFQSFMNQTLLREIRKTAYTNSPNGKFKSTNHLNVSRHSPGNKYGKYPTECGALPLHNHSANQFVVRLEDLTAPSCGTLHRVVLQKFADVSEVLTASITRAIIEVTTSETSINFYQTTRRNISEDSHLQLVRWLVC
jgi:hypothetical protein